MPQVLVPIFVEIGAALGGVAALGEAGLIVAAGYAATATILVGTLALSQYQRRKAERAARAQFDASQVDRLANLPLTIAPRELVLGRVRKGGTLFYRASAGAFQNMFYMTIALAAHEIDGIEAIEFNDQRVEVDPIGQVLTAPYGRSDLRTESQNFYGTSVVLAHTPYPGTVTVVMASSAPGMDATSSQVPYTLSGNTVTIAGFDSNFNYYVTYQWVQTTSYATVAWHLGTPDQAADGMLIEGFPGWWTAAHRAAGVAYLVVRCLYDETAFPSGLPNVTVVFRGAKLHDPRTGTSYWNENMALMMRHVLMHPQFGKRAAMTAEEDARIVATANACDTAIDYGGGVTQMFRGGIVIPFGSPARDVLDDLAQAMGGEWADSAGEFHLHAGVWTAQVMNLYDKDLAVVQREEGGKITQVPITISPHRARNEKINTVIARIWDQAANYVQTAISPRRVDAYVADDGAELMQEVTMPAVFYAYQAYHIAGIMLRDSRDPLTVVAPFKLSAYGIELFDNVTLTLERYGWVAKNFRVMGRTFMPAGYVMLTLKETAPAIFQWGAGFIPGGYADNTGLPNPWNIQPPAITSVTSGTSDLIVQSDGTVINGVRVSWTPIADLSITNNGFIEMQYQDVTEGIWKSVTVPGEATQAVLVGLPDLAIVTIRARTRNSVATSPWSVQVYHQVIGKTEPPPNIEGLTVAGSVLSWTMPLRVPDLAGFVFRFHYGNNLDWNSAAPLNDGVITASPYDLVTRPNGVVTIMGKAIDTTGNLSLTTANIVMNLGDAPIANVVEQWDFDALGWPYEAGAQSAWTIVSGKPSADSIDSFYGTDDQSFYGADTDPFYEPAAYAQMVYVTEPIGVGAALAGSVMTLEIEVEGIDLRVEYRLAGPAPFYGPDNSSFYGPDADAFYDPPGDWMPWPGQVAAANDVYQFRVTIGASATRGVLQSMVLTIDAPDMTESLADVPISASGTAVPYTKNYTKISTVQVTLQANGSGAVRVETVKTVNLSPVIRAFNSSNVAVSGATVDIDIQGY